MTVSDLSLDDSIDKYDFSNQLDCSQMPLTRWGHIQLLSSPLYPSKCEIRPIENRGALCDSIRNSNIDLFDRVPHKEGVVVKLARLVGIVASFLFINLVLAPIGTLYHAAHAIKNAALILFRSGHRLDQIVQTIEQLLLAGTDAVHFVIPFIVGGAFLTGGAPFLVTAAAVAVTSLGCSLFFGEVVDLKEKVCKSFSREDCYGLYKSIRLREEFGIVDSKTGGFLNWDPKKDADVTTSRTRFGLGYKLNGYFIDLHKERAEKFLNTIQSLQTSLPENYKIPFCYPPKAETIIAFLKEAPTELSPLKEWEQTLLTQEADMKLIWDIISRGFTLSSEEVSSTFHGSYTITRTTTYTLPEQFPLNEEDCQKYFHHLLEKI
jgi:hypothetical protein